MANLDQSTYSAVLKTLYPTGLWDALLPKSALLNVIGKDTSAQGEGKFLVSRFAPSSGLSSQFSTAQTNRSPGQVVRFFVTPYSFYVNEAISTLTLRAAAGNKGAIVSAVEFTSTCALNAFQRALGAMLYGDGGAALGQITAGSNPATPTITLTRKSDAIHFWKGQKLQVSVDAGNLGIANAGVKAGTVTVAGVNKNLGTITCTGNWTAGIATCIAGDYVFIQDTYASWFPGLGGYVPPTDPTAGDSFLNVDRSVSPVELSGVKVSANGASIEETLIDAANTLANYGVSPDVCMMNFADFASLTKSRQSKVQLVDVRGVDAALGFRAFEIDGPRGSIQVIPDADCPVGTAWIMDKSGVKLTSYGEYPGYLSDDGNGNLLRSYNADLLELRIGGFAYMEVDPICVARVTL